MVLIINGPCGIGKTTLSKQLAKHLDNCILINGDEIHNFIMNNEVTDEQLELTNNNITSLVVNFLCVGYKNIIIDFVYENENHIQYIKEKIYPTPIICVRISSELDINLQRNSSRQKDDVMSSERVQELYRVFLTKGDRLGYEVNTNGDTIEESVGKIFDLIKDKGFL